MLSISVFFLFYVLKILILLHLIYVYSAGFCFFFCPMNLSDPFCNNENVIRRKTFTLSSTFNSFGSKANEKENENENVVYARLCVHV